MALRIPWDKQETALLIDAYLRLKNKELSQQEAVKEVSTLLRRRAILSGMEIDDVFRNTNGITMQMKIIGGLLDNRPSGLHSATKMFNEMVRLYKSEPDVFHEILIQAKGECLMQVNVQEKFFVWLAARVSSAQLSEFYIVCKDIEYFCVSKHILTEPLFETTNTVIIQGVIDTIKSNRLFQLKYFRHFGKMRKVMDYYMTFLRENPLYQSKEPENVPLSNNEIVAHSKDYIEVKNTATSDLEPVMAEQTEATVSVNEEEKTLAESNEDSIEGVAIDEVVLSENINSETLVWNFANDNVDFSNASPTAITYFGEEENVQDWADAFVKIIRAMQEDYPSIIRGMVGYHLVGIGKVVLTGIAGISKFGKPIELNNGLFLETDCSPNEMVSIVRVLMDKCNMDYDNIELYYEEPESDVVITDNYQTVETVVSEEEPLAEGVQDYIVQVLEKLNIPYVDHRNNNGCLWIIGDRRISPVFEDFYEYSVVFHYKEDGGRATKGEPAWWTKDVIVFDNESEANDVVEQPIKENEKPYENVLNITSAAEGKVAFENWLITGVGLAVRSAKSYSSAINVAGQYSVKWGFSENELFYILDAEQVYQISMKLLANPEFTQLNDGQHNRYRAALSKYWDYCKALFGGVTVPIRNAPEQENEIKKNRIDFIAWAQAQQIQNAAILVYLSDIKKCSEFAQENNYIKEKHILLIQDANTLERVFLEMRKDRRFVELNNERQKRPVSAMNKLIAFRRATATGGEQKPIVSVPVTSIEKPVQRPNVSVTTASVNPQVKERYTAILAENFVDGFRPAKAIDRNRFRMYYGDIFGEELTEDDESFVRTLMKIGTFRDERIFVKDETEQKDLLEEINDTITETFKDGASCIYLDCLFTRFQEQLAEMLHIYNEDSLESVLFSSGKRNYFKRYNYLLGYNKEPAPNRDVIEYMKKSNLPVTYSEIENGLWYIPLDKIKHTLVTTPGIVNVASEAYLYAPNLPVSENEIQQIAELISHALLQRNYISDVELMQLIEEHCPSVLMNTPDYPMWGLRNALAYLLRDKFSFRGAIISGKDEEISMAEVFTDFCQRSEHITVDELKQFASELNTVIYWDSVYSEMVRINQNEFVRKDHIHFDVEHTDSVLENLIQSAYIPIKTINLFLHFPAIDVPWNNFVLESYVAHYSKKFRLLHASFTATDCCGAMVRQDSGISDYRTLIVDVLAKNTGWKNKKDALQLLVDLGYQQRRSYSDIEKVMQEAKAKLQIPKK